MNLTFYEMYILLVTVVANKPLLNYFLQQTSQGH